MKEALAGKESETLTASIVKALPFDILSHPSEAKYAQNKDIQVYLALQGKGRSSTDMSSGMETSICQTPQGTAYVSSNCQTPQGTTCLESSTDLLFPAGPRAKSAGSLSKKTAHEALRKDNSQSSIGFKSTTPTPVGEGTRKRVDATPVPRGKEANRMNSGPKSPLTLKLLCSENAMLPRYGGSRSNVLLKIMKRVLSGTRPRSQTGPVTTPETENEEDKQEQENVALKRDLVKDAKTILEKDRDLLQLFKSVYIPDKDNTEAEAITDTDTPDCPDTRGGPNVTRNDNSKENVLARDYNSKENVPARDHNSKENVPTRDHNSRENIPTRDHNSRENVPARDHNSKENVPTRDHNSKENVLARDYSSKENVPARDHNSKENIPARDHNSKENVPTRDHISRENIPTRDNNSKENLPARNDNSKGDVPTKNHSSKEFIPTRDHNSREHVPARDYNSKENVPSRVHSSKENVPRDHNSRANIPTKNNSSKENFLTRDYNSKENVPSRVHSSKGNVSSRDQNSKENAVTKDHNSKEEVSAQTDITSKEKVSTEVMPDRRTEKNGKERSEQPHSRSSSRSSQDTSSSEDSSNEDDLQGTEPESIWTPESSTFAHSPAKSKSSGDAIATTLRNLIDQGQSGPSEVSPKAQAASPKSDDSPKPDDLRESGSEARTLSRREVTSLAEDNSEETLRCVTQDTISREKHSALQDKATVDAAISAVALQSLSTEAEAEAVSDTEVTPANKFLFLNLKSSWSVT